MHGTRMVCDITICCLVCSFAFGGPTAGLIYPLSPLRVFAPLQQNMYMTAMSQNPAAMMLMPYMTQYPMYSRLALPTDVGAPFVSVTYQ